MDIFKFQDTLLDMVNANLRTEVKHALYDVTMKMYAYETDEVKMANALVDTAYSLLYSARDGDGIETYISVLENKLDIMKRSKNYVMMKNRTSAIENPSQE